MIVIVGAAHDDVLYFENVLLNRKEEVILSRYKIYTGTIFSQEVIVIDEMFTSILSASVMTYILEKYYVDLVITVGKCISISPNIKNGDIVVSDMIIDGNVDISLFTDNVTGQIPGFQRDFKVQNDIINYLLKGLSKRTFVTASLAAYISSDNLSYEMIDILKQRRTAFGIRSDNIVIDYNSSGVALASTLKNIPFISVKVAENKIDQKNNINTYLKVLDRYIDLGKAVVSTINDIGRRDILKGR